MICAVAIYKFYLKDFYQEHWILYVGLGVGVLDNLFFGNGKLGKVNDLCTSCRFL